MLFEMKEENAALNTHLSQVNCIQNNRIYIQRTAIKSFFIYLHHILVEKKQNVIVCVGIKPNYIKRLNVNNHYIAIM